MFPYSRAAIKPLMNAMAFPTVCHAYAEFGMLVHWVVCVLTLEGVHHGTDRDVDDEDEDFSTNEALVEIHWSPHFSHQLYKKRSTTVCKHSIHQTIDVIGDGRSFRPICGDTDGLSRGHLV